MMSNISICAFLDIINMLPYSTVEEVTCKSCLEVHAPHILNKIHSFVSDDDKIIEYEKLGSLAGSLAQIVQILSVCISVLQPNDLKKYFFSINSDCTKILLDKALSNIGMHRRHLRRHTGDSATSKMKSVNGKKQEILSAAIEHEQLHKDSNLICLSESNDHDQAFFLSFQLSLFLLKSVGDLLSELIQALDVNDLDETILPVVETLVTRFILEKDILLSGTNSESCDFSWNTHDLKNLKYFPEVSLGISLCRRLMEVFGKISFESQHPSLHSFYCWTTSLR